jgi:hypothetical protein
MVLSKQQTFEHFLVNVKIEALNYKFKFTSKTKWYCLACNDILYISYKQAGLYSIFCPKCYNKYQHKPTMVQYQYLMRLKSEQLKLVESQLNNIEK